VRALMERRRRPLLHPHVCHAISQLPGRGPVTRSEPFFTLEADSELAASDLHVRQAARLVAGSPGQQLVHDYRRWAMGRSQASHWGLVPQRGRTIRYERVAARISADGMYPLQLLR